MTATSGGREGGERGRGGGRVEGSKDKFTNS